MLGLVVTDHLFRTQPEMPEGELAKVRASVVNSAALAELAAELGIGEALLLGKGEDQSGGREKPSILADATEALIGAVYIDRGWEAAEAMVMRPARVSGSRSAAAGPGGQDYKTRLQELCARDVRPAARLRRAATKDPTTPSSSTRWCTSQGRPGRASGGAGPRSRPSRRPPSQAWEHLATERVLTPERRRQMAPRRPGGAEVPELPEVETIRRDLERSSSAKRIKKVEVTGRPVRCAATSGRGLREVGSKGASWSEPAGGAST